MSEQMIELKAYFQNNPEALKFIFLKNVSLNKAALNILRIKLKKSLFKIIYAFNTALCFLFLY